MSIASYNYRVREVALHRSPLYLFRGISLCCLLFLLLTLLVACGGPPATQGSSTGGKTVITEMDYYADEPTKSEIDKLFKEYEQTHPGVTIQRDIVPIGSELAKADQEAASHTLPDVLMLDNPNLANFASTGALTPLDSYLQSSHYNLSDFYQGALSGMTYNEKTYGFSLGNNDLALFYNKDQFKAAGLTPPTTWVELSQDAKKLTHGNTYGFALSAPATEEGSWQFEPFFWSNGGNLTNVDNAQGVGALQFLTQLVQQGSMSKAVVNWTQADVEQQFQQGNAAMMVNGPWQLALLHQSHVNYGIVPIPVPQMGGKSVSPIGGEVWTLPLKSDSNQTQAAWNLINWLGQPAQLTDFDKVQGYIPPLKTASQQLVQGNPELTIFSAEMNTAQARTAVVGTKYPQISQALWTAEQAALIGSMSPLAALQQAQQQIATLLKG